MANNKAQNSVRPAKNGDKGTVRPLEAPEMKKVEIFFKLFFNRNMLWISQLHEIFYLLNI